MLRLTNLGGPYLGGLQKIDDGALIDIECKSLNPTVTLTLAAKAADKASLSVETGRIWHLD